MQQSISAQSIMDDYAASTGLSDASREPRRYLWTDAFAVCNYLQLYTQTGEQRFLQLALDLVAQVHLTLGQHRKDSLYSGWLSGLKGEQAAQHPTRGGLRIGKQLDERQPGEPVDEALEWNREGQYFHYLTKWMHALNRVSQVTGEDRYNQWALELARVAHTAFTYTPVRGSAKRMYWKMSVDLSRPLVPSMGQHDPLDGLITYWQLQATAQDFATRPSALSLDTEIAELLVMCAGQNWASDDPLSIGGLLSDAYKLVQLIAAYKLDETVLLESLLGNIQSSLESFTRHDSLNHPAEYRLAFRELGLTIGLHAIHRMQNTIKQRPEHFTRARQLLAALDRLSSFCRLQQAIESFWLAADHQSVKSWGDHLDINSVMLATSLAPDGYLQL